MLVSNSTQSDILGRVKSCEIGIKAETADTGCVTSRIGTSVQLCLYLSRNGLIIVRPFFSNSCERHLPALIISMSIEGKNEKTNQAYTLRQSNNCASCSALI